MKTNEKPALSLMLDRDFIKRVGESRGLKIDVSESGLSHGEGLRAEFHPDGSLSYFSHHRDGKPTGWVLKVTANSEISHCHREQTLSYPENAELDPDDDKRETLKEWVERWIVDICEDAETTLRCAFCGKGKEEVQILLSGRNDTYLCDECVILMAEVIQDRLADDDKPKSNA